MMVHREWMGVQQQSVVPVKPKPLAMLVQFAQVPRWVPKTSAEDAVMERRQMHEVEEQRLLMVETIEDRLMEIEMESNSLQELLSDLMKNRPSMSLKWEISYQKRVDSDS